MWSFFVGPVDQQADAVEEYVNADEDPYEPSKPEYLIPASCEQVEETQRSLLERQIKHLEESVAKRRLTISPDVAVHYTHVLDEMYGSSTGAQLTHTRTRSMPHRLTDEDGPPSPRPLVRQLSEPLPSWPSERDLEELGARAEAACGEEAAPKSEAQGGAAEEEMKGPRPAAFSAETANLETDSVQFDEEEHARLAATSGAEEEVKAARPAALSAETANLEMDTSALTLLLEEEEERKEQRARTVTLVDEEGLDACNLPVDVDKAPAESGSIILKWFVSPVSKLSEVVGLTSRDNTGR